MRRPPAARRTTHSARAPDASCRAIGVCSGDGEGSQCGWATCYDDVAFVRSVVQDLGSIACLDLDAVFATGYSNGGMLVHRLAAAAPRLLAGIVPIYGLPLKGDVALPAAARGTALLQIHDRSDESIPIDGGPSAQGWCAAGLMGFAGPS